VTGVADQAYWDALYEKAPLVYQPERVLFKDLFDRFLRPGGTCLEIGCYPGGFLIYLSRRFGYVVSGIDTTPLVGSRLPAHLQEHGVKVGRLLQADFFAYKPEETYDVVCSFGFLEHFENTEEGIRRHIRLVKPGGMLVLSCPHLRRANYLLHRLLNAEDLRRHVTASMDLALWERLLTMNGMTIIYQNYYRTFHFWNASPVRSLPNRVLTKVLRTFGNPIDRVVNLPNRWTSPYMISFSKRAGAGDAS
jgi:SAM-dependent methyltransferase